MKTLSSSLLHPTRRGIFLVVTAVAAALAIPSGWAIPLTGANGRTVDFAGIKSAGPKGLSVQIKPEGEVIEVGWEKFDLQKVAAQFPEIGEAYKRSLNGESTDLNLGTFAPAKPAMPATPPKPPPGVIERPGVFHVKLPGNPEAGFDSASFVVSIPEGTEPKGILLLAIGVDGNSIRYFSRQRNTGPWASYQRDLGFAILAYDFFGPMKMNEAPSFVFAEKGSGEALLSALDQLSEKSGKRLSDLPIAIYGRDILGGSFAFNFAQWKPEKVVAAVAGKGAFYATPPSPESARVPLLMIWGEFDRSPDLWKSTHTHSQVFEKYVHLKPNWIDAMEPRAVADESPQCEALAEAFLKNMIDVRMQGGELAPVDRSKAWVGDLKALSIQKLEDPEAELPATQTWLPDQSFAEMWEKFVNMRLTLSEEAAQ